ADLDHRFCHGSLAACDHNGRRSGCPAFDADSFSVRPERRREAPRSKGACEALRTPDQVRGRLRLLRKLRSARTGCGILFANYDFVSTFAPSLRLSGASTITVSPAATPASTWRDSPMLPPTDTARRCALLSLTTNTMSLSPSLRSAPPGTSTPRGACC